MWKKETAGRPACRGLQETLVIYSRHLASQSPELYHHVNKPLHFTHWTFNNSRPRSSIDDRKRVVRTNPTRYNKELLPYPLPNPSPFQPPPSWLVKENSQTVTIEADSTKLIRCQLRAPCRLSTTVPVVLFYENMAHQKLKNKESMLKQEKENREI